MYEAETLIGRRTLSDNFELSDRTFRSFLFYSSVTGHTTLFSRAILEHIMPLPEEGYYDWWIGFVAIYHNKITCLNECLTLHRIHHSSVMHNFKGDEFRNTKIDRANEISTNLSILKQYKNLNQDDRQLISRIQISYNKQGISLYLIRLIYKYYQDFFPDLKSRKGLSRLNFAIKFAVKA